MDRSGRWTHGLVLTSPFWTVGLAMLMPGSIWPGACIPSLSMPLFSLVALIMGLTHLLDPPRSWGWGLGMLAAAGVLFGVGYVADTWIQLAETGPCIPRGWERWPWLY